MVSLFERLDKGRPPPEEAVKPPRRPTTKELSYWTDWRAAWPVTRIEERGAAHGFSKKQLIYAKQHWACCFQTGGKAQRPRFWRLDDKHGSRRSGQHRTPGGLARSPPSQALVRHEDGRAQHAPAQHALRGKSSEGQLS